MNAATSRRARMLTGTLAACVLAGNASAQAWRWHFLDSLDSRTEALPLAAEGEYQGGYAFTGGVPHPVLWKSGPDVSIDLLPASRSSGEVFGMSADRQVGYATLPNVYHAAAWRGTPESYVNLNPSGYYASYAHAVRGQQIAGFAQTNTTGDPHAALWTGPTDTFVDLHNNALATISYAFATDGEHQGGWAAYRASGRLHATLWLGSSSTMIDINPSWVSESVILAMAPGVQVGRVAISPCLWHGTAESARVMHPAGYGGGGELRGTDGTHHVGYAIKNGAGYAGIWMSDDPNSFVDLAAMVGSNVSGSAANALYSDANHIYVAGQIRLGNGPLRGVVWVQDVSAPGAAALIMVAGVCGAIRRRRPDSSAPPAGRSGRPGTG